MQKFWPADLQMIGKEIVRFHCVYWPAISDGGRPATAEEHRGARLAAVRREQDVEVARQHRAHGDDSRRLGRDALRYFLLREIVFGQDGSFSFDALVQRYNADLANGLGNLASRTLTMITRYFNGEVPYPSATSHTAADEAIAETARGVIAEFNSQFEQYQFSKALEAAWSLVAAVDKYIVENEPWALGREAGRRKPGAAGHGALHRGRGVAHRDGAGASGDS